MEHLAHSPAHSELIRALRNSKLPSHGRYCVLNQRARARYPRAPAFRCDGFYSSESIAVTASQTKLLLVLRLSVARRAVRPAVGITPSPGRCRAPLGVAGARCPQDLAFRG